MSDFVGRVEEIVNIIIVDDEELIGKGIANYVNKYYEMNKMNHSVRVITFNSECQLFDYIESGNKADIIFMDIRLKRLNGIDIAVKLQKNDSSLKIVFITGYIEYAKDIFDAKPEYFLVKPVRQEDVDKVLDKIEVDLADAGRDVIIFKIEQVVYCINKNDIYYIEAEGRYVNICTSDKKYRIIGNLSEYYNKLKDIMESCHRSYVVNLDKIETIDKYEVRLISGESIPMSRRKREELEKRLLLK